MSTLRVNSGNADDKPPLFRNEWKYYLSLWDGQTLKERLIRLMQRDPYAVNGVYMIRSLYFDDYWNSSYNDKMAGVDHRKKYRIRIYNCSDSSIKLERKIKNSSYIFKESASLTRREYEWIMEGNYDFLLRHSDRLCREFYYECVGNVMRPKVIVDYEGTCGSPLTVVSVLRRRKMTFLIHGFPPMKWFLLEKR